MTKKKRKARLGSGKRFKGLVSKLKRRAKKKGRKIKNPDALAAWIGRKKYGKKKFQKLSRKGKR